MAKDTAYHEERARFVDLLYNGPLMLPRRYVFILTNRCNLSCDFCSQSKAKLENAMTASDWIPLLDQLPMYATITITGGEPLLFPGFAEVFSRITERFPCNVITNGLLLNADLLRSMLVKPQFKVLSLSIDDIGNTCRGMLPTQWEQLKTVTGLIRDIRAEVGSKAVFDIKTVVLDENAASLAEIHRYCIEELSCDTHCFQFLKGSPFQHSDTMINLDAVVDKRQNQECYSSWETICEQMELIRRYNMKNGTSCFCHPKVFDLTSTHPLSSTPSELFNQETLDITAFTPCKAPWESVHINADGTLFPCLSIGMGDVRSQSLQEIIFSDPYDLFRTNLRDRGLFPACRRCGYLSAKHGV